MAGWLGGCQVDVGMKKARGRGLIPSLVSPTELAQGALVVALCCGEDSVDYHLLVLRCMKLLLLGVILKGKDLIKEHKLQGRAPGNGHQRHATW